MNLEESLQSLSNHESFAAFIFMLRDLREECIEELHNAEFEKIQQLSGRIITYDQILKIANLRLLEKRFG